MGKIQIFALLMFFLGSILAGWALGFDSKHGALYAIGMYAIFIISVTIGFAIRYFWRT